MTASGARAYVVVDVFTDTPLAGNALAVFTDAGGLDAATMQRLARELNLSESVFLTGPADGDDDAVGVRIFTPFAELPFAGHPVLGAACVIGRDGGTPTVRLATGSGIVGVALRRDGGVVRGGEMEQPIPTWAPFPHAPRLLAALGVRSRLPVEVYDNGPRHVFVVLRDSAQVAALAPDLGALATLGPFGVSCLAVDGHRVHTRMFGPGLGVAEDPATGSAAGPLAVHLARHGVVAFGTRLTVAQGVEIGRPSRLEAVAESTAGSITRVAVAGDAVIVAEGAFRLGGGVG